MLSSNPSGRLDAACVAFRDAFASGGVDEHRSTCSRCAAWAAQREAASAGRSTRRLPGGLVARLQGIPLREVVCRDTDRLFEATRGAAAGAPRDLAVERHLMRCDRCRRLYGALRTAMACAALPVPDSLLARLASMAPARPRRMPGWVRDGRWAAAASLVLAMLLVLIAESARPVTDAGVAQVTSLWQQSVPAVDQRVRAVGAGLSRGIDRGGENLEQFGDGFQRLARRSRQIFEPTKLPELVRNLRTRGDDDVDG